MCQLTLSSWWRPCFGSCSSRWRFCHLWAGRWPRLRTHPRLPHRTTHRLNTEAAEHTRWDRLLSQSRNLRLVEEPRGSSTRWAATGKHSKYRLHPVAVKVVVSLLLVKSHQPSTPQLVPVILPHWLNTILAKRQTREKKDRIILIIIKERLELAFERWWITLQLKIKLYYGKQAFSWQY